jgi:hypothetical protein
MGSERLPETMPGSPSPSANAGRPDAADRALRAQLLATEHWSLLATRSLSWSESFARAGMFLTLLSGAIVALALVAQATSFGNGFVLFALLLLPAVLMVGLATYVRLLEVNNEDAVWVAGMNRLRRAYLELDPELSRHLVTGTTLDVQGMLRTYGSLASHSHAPYLHGFVTTPTTIAFVDALIAAALAAVLVADIGMQMAPAGAAGVLAFLAVFAALFLYGMRTQEMARLVLGRQAAAIESPVTSALGSGDPGEGDGDQLAL